MELKDEQDKSEIKIELTITGDVPSRDPSPLPGQDMRSE